METPKEQYETVCKDQFGKILDQLKSIDDRLFIDNGDECLQSKINRHDRWIKAVAAFLAITGCGIFGILCWIAKIMITKVL